MTSGNNLFDLSGKTALITGGGSGIGAFLAGALSDAGAKILLVGRRQEKLDAVLSQKVGASFAFDLAQNGAATKLADTIFEAGFSPDIIVNAAGANPRAHADSIDGKTGRKPCIST